MRVVGASRPSAAAVFLLFLAVMLTTVAAAAASPAGTPADPVYVDQAWSPADRSWFYTTSQGSRLMPYDWFLALEEPDSATPFRADGLARFGYLPNPPSPDNRDGLPVGFVRDNDIGGGKPWVGMTCAACHTSQVDFAGTALQIDGGPTNADMFALIRDLGKALAQTASNEADSKFQRFADKVLGSAHTPADADALHGDLATFSADFTEYVGHSTSTTTVWGPARLDAFGMIFNRATAIDLRDAGNNHEPNAPVSYPFLWDTSWHDKVQWNGSAPNDLEFERLARNVGEVLGVFAQTDIQHTFPPPLFFWTSANRLNLLLLEDRLKKLRSPQWPQSLAAIDPVKREAGKALYQTHCRSCHDIVARNEPNRRVEVTMTSLAEIRTDPKMAENAVALTSKSGVIEGVRMPLIPFLVPPLKETEPSVNLVVHIVVGAILAPPDWLTLPPSLSNADVAVAHAISTGRVALAALPNDLHNLARNSLYKQAQDYLAKRRGLNPLAYKARPLDGIWAAAPYLHNGSVPNLYQLLLPAAQPVPGSADTQCPTPPCRDATFFVGSRVFDPVNVGFRFDEAAGGFKFDTSIPGNWNSGHDGPEYGTSTLTEEQRWQLVEYLKTL
jgi:mono/diheme cytochrome c family protein